MHMRQAWSTLITDPHIRRIALLVVAYGLSLNTVEICWRDAMGKAFAGDSVAYSQFMGQFWTWTGVATFVGMMASHRVLALTGFRTAVSVAPVCLLAIGVTFFWSLLLLQSEVVPLNPMVVVYLGTVQSIASKA